MTTLAALIAGGRRFEVDHAIFIVVGCCTECVRYNLQHTISPHRIVLSATGHVALTTYSPLAPDLGYVAPEVVDHARRGHARDVHVGEDVKVGFVEPSEHPIDWPPAMVFSLGCILWELLAGRPLFHGETDYQSLQLAHAAVVPPLPDAPPALEAIVRKALAKNVAERYQTPGELGAALAQYLVDRAKS